MRKCIYVRLIMGSANVWATDPSILNWILAEVKKQVPTCAVRGEELDLTGARIGFQLHQLQNN